MLFNTIDFIIFFIVTCFVIITIKNRKFQHLFLLLASYFFFYYTSNYLITLLIFTTIWDFYFGNFIHKSTNHKKKKLLLIISLTGNLALLGFFKYADFVITQINFIGNIINLDQIPLMNIVLPIGISFYTFHSITYTVSIYRGIIQPTKTLTEYAIFVAFFPQLVAGPILRAKDFLPQLREKIETSPLQKLKLIKISENNLKIGITIMALGFLKKMFFADNISPMVNEVFSNPMIYDSTGIILSTIGFGIQIYCDFSGYSDIAIGAATILGFKIPINFNKPYFATSPSDFWRRWHISLSTWLRDYLYIPLGGNRKSKLRTYGNLMIVMFLGGLWHGASINFIVWGLLHGGYLAINHLLVGKFPKLCHINNKIIKLTSIFITQYLVFLAWIAFRIKDTNHMLYAMQKFVLIDLSSSYSTQFISAHKFPLLIMFLFVVLHIVSYKKINLQEKISNSKNVFWILFLISIILSILFTYNSNPEDFIYFQF